MQAASQEPKVTAAIRNQKSPKAEYLKTLIEMNVGPTSRVKRRR
jgi:hypothetical protein